MNLSREERETCITFTEADNIAIVYTCSKPMMNRMDNLCLKNPICIVTKKDEWSKTYEVPIACVLPRKLPMQTDELKAKRAARGRELSEKRNGKANNATTGEQNTY